MVTAVMFEEITKRLVEAYDPVTIYLFGSYAWGTPHKDSDVDLAIIVEKAEERRYKRAWLASDALRGMPISKDVIVYTKEEFDKAVAKSSSLAKKIFHEGKVLYGQA